MENFARIIVGYHGCEGKLANGLLTGKVPIAAWNKSDNAYDWLGEGIYFWEHSPTRAFRWASERFGRRAAVVGAVIQFGNCFDLLDENIIKLLGVGHAALAEPYSAGGNSLPINKGKEKKLRELDCAVINYCVFRAGLNQVAFDTVRGAFLEGPPIFPGTTISSQARIQVAVRNSDCILARSHSSKCGPNPKNRATTHQSLTRLGRCRRS